MFGTDPVAPDSPAPAVQFSALLWIAIAAFFGVGVGAILFENHPSQTDAVQRSQSPRRDPDPTPPERQPHAIVETQIARKSTSALRVDGFHRFAVFNAGSAALKMARGAAGNHLRVEVSSELDPGDVGYVTVIWSRLEVDAIKQIRRSANVLTNDPLNKTIQFVIAEDRDIAE